MSLPARLFLSPPHMGGEELRFIHEAFESNYIAPLGPMVDAFEREFASYIGLPHCLALSSGTAAMHLALRELGVGPGDEVIASSLTFIGSVTPALFQGASLVFLDSDRSSWNMDPDLLAEELEACARRGKLPKAVIPTDLYGQCADLNRILPLCAAHRVPVVADAAEALGARYRPGSSLDVERSSLNFRGSSPPSPGSSLDVGCSSLNVGCSASPTPSSPLQAPCFSLSPSSVLGPPSSGPSVPVSQCPSVRSPTSDLRPPTSGFVHSGVGARAAVFSFNGNKIITTSGGGMLASEDKALIEHARKLSQQARDPAPHYEHTEYGYNYRMSNIVAAIGRGQMRVLDDRVRRKREIFETYRRLLGDLPGIEFMPEAAHSVSNRWLTVILIEAQEFGASNEQVRLALEAENIESRPIWKPMHLQPVFRGHRVRGGRVSEALFRDGLCLPSGTAITESDLERVARIIRRCHRG